MFSSNFQKQIFIDFKRISCRCLTFTVSIAHVLALFSPPLFITIHENLAKLSTDLSPPPRKHQPCTPVIARVYEAGTVKGQLIMHQAPKVTFLNKIALPKVFCM
jgi:hypothetical protein